MTKVNIKSLNFCHNFNFYNSFVKYYEDHLNANNIFTKTLVSVKKSHNYSQNKYPNSLFTFYRFDLHFNLLSMLISSFYIYKKLSRHRPLIVHCHMTRGATIPLLLSYFLKIKNRVYHNHGFTFIGYTGILKYLFLFIEHVNVFLSTKVISVSRSNLYVYFKYLSSIPIHKFHILHNGSAIGYDCTNQTLKSSNKNFVFGYVGRPKIRKGYSDLINAWTLSRLSDHGHILKIAGFTISEISNIPQKKLSNVQFLGFLDDMNPFYASIDLLVLPSHHEGFGQCILEAASHGVPTLSSAIPGVLCAIRDKKTGFLHKKKNIYELSEKLVYLSNEKSFVQSVGYNAKNHFNSNFHRNDIFNELLEFYRKCIS